MFFDLETTGIEITESHIIEITMAKENHDGSMESKVQWLNQRGPIPPKAIAMQMWQTNLRESAGARAEFLTKCDLAGYNLIRFDLPLLEKEFARE